jgi:hypothetical protein
MSKRGKRTAALAAFAAVLSLAACTGGSDEAAPETVTSIEADTPTAEVMTTEAVDELERDQKVSEFLDAVESNANCTSAECSTAQAMHDRYQNLYELAGEIGGDDVVVYVTAMSSAWDAWNDCLLTAETRFDRFDCADDSNMEQAVSDLYNALRST